MKKPELRGDIIVMCPEFHDKFFGEGMSKRQFKKMVREAKIIKLNNIEDK